MLCVNCTCVSLFRILIQSMYFIDWKKTKTIDIGTILMHRFPRFRFVVATDVASRSQKTQAKTEMRPRRADFNMMMG